MNNSIQVTYSDTKLRILVEEFIAMQKAGFTFKEVSSYILYRAMDEEKTTNTGLYETNQLDDYDCKRLGAILEKIKNEGRINIATEGDDKAFLKI